MMSQGMDTSAYPVYNIYETVIQPAPSVIDNAISNNKTSSRSSPSTANTILGQSGDFFGGDTTIAKSAEPAPVDNKGFLGISTPMWAISALGTSGSYFTGFGSQSTKRLFNIGEESSEGLLKASLKQGAEDTPIIGKQISSALFTETGEGIVKKSLETGAEVGGKSLLKSGLKTSSKIGLASIPIIGTLAGTFFDMRVSDKSFGSAITANIVGDVVGGGAVAATAPLALTGVGALVPLGAGIAGQVGGEQATYLAIDKFGAAGNELKTDWLTKLSNIVTFSPFEDEKDVEKMGMFDGMFTMFSGSEKVVSASTANTNYGQSGDFFTGNNLSTTSKVNKGSGSNRKVDISSGSVSLGGGKSANAYTNAAGQNVVGGLAFSDKASAAKLKGNAPSKSKSKSSKSGSSSTYTKRGQTYNKKTGYRVSNRKR